MPREPMGLDELIDALKDIARLAVVLAVSQLLLKLVS
jgi:hypothetical protein